MRRRAVLITTVVVVAIVFLLIGPGVSFYTDLLWFRDVGYTQIFRSRITLQILLFVFGTIGFALIAGVNVTVARRLSPLRPLAITNDFLFNLRRTLDPVIRYVIVGVVAVVALIFGSSAMPQWTRVLMFENAQLFPSTDPVFHKNVGFYVFRLPMWDYALHWLFVALIITILVVAAVYAYAGAIGPQPEGGYVAPHPRNHLAVLLGFVMLLKAAFYQIDQWELLNSPGGTWAGAMYTEVNAQLPAYRVLFWIAIISAILLFLTFLWKRLVVPIVAIGLMVITAIIIGGVYPRIIQATVAGPSLAKAESPYVRQNIKYTKQGFRLDNVQLPPVQGNADLPAAALAANSQTLRNLRLWDDDPLKQNLQQQQPNGQYYLFNSVGVDRYPIGAQRTMTLTSAREVSIASLSAQDQNWQNGHLVYTHGFGAVVSRSNDVTSTGDPSLMVRDVPPQNLSGSPALDIAQPRIYFGEETSNYVLVDTSRPELDGKTDASSAQYHYTGNAGIHIDSFFNRLAYAIKFGDAQILLTDAILPQSKLLYNRAIADRLHAVAPFLTLDQSPYMAIIDGRLVWILDAYTTTTLYPDSQPLTTDLQEDAPYEGVNYIRNSVKVTVDTFTGKMTLYRVDESDPIAKAWDKALPGLFKENSDVPAAIRPHFRYPIDVFRIQAEVWGKYHMPVDQFIGDQNHWDIAPGSANQSETNLNSQPSQSQYLEMRIPGIPDAVQDEFVLDNSFVQRGKPYITALFLARSDPAHYGEIVSPTIDSANQVNSPAQVSGIINSVPDISKDQSLLNSGGSRLDQGQIKVVPIDQSIIYVQPWFVSARNDNPRPQLKRVILVFGTKVVSQNNLPDALQAMFGFSPIANLGQTQQPVITPGTTPSPTGPPLASDVGALVQQASGLYGQMQDALRAGDFAKYGDLQKQLGDALQQLQSKIGSASASTPPTTAAQPGR